MKNTKGEINQLVKDVRCLKLFVRKIRLIFLGNFKHCRVRIMSMGTDGGAGNANPNVSPDGTSHPTSATQFQAYYPTQTPTPTFSDKLGEITGHPLSKQVVDFVKQKNIMYAIAVGALLVSAVVIIFMIPQSTEPIEGTWLKSDGQELEFESNGDFSNEIYPGSTWSIDGDILTMFSTVQVIENQQSYTRIIVQTVEISFTDDEQAMWWIWNSVTIDDEEQELADNSCSLLLKTSTAKNSFEYGINAPKYESDKPSLCQ